MNIELCRQVGLVEARAHLSELIDLVEAGETIELTRSGRTVAMVTPVAPRRRTIDLASLQRITDSMPFGDLECGDFVHRQQDASRY